MIASSSVNTSLPPAILLMGPTASGKTDLAVALCQHLRCEIISVDSAMVYRSMDIGTAKPDAAMLAQAPHRLIDIRDPAEPYSAAEFRRDALAVMAEITAAGKIPLLVGGTMLYFRVLMDGIADLPSADAPIRARLEAEAADLGWPALHARLAQVDPLAAARLHPNHSQRIQRALEVFELTGRSLSDWQREAGRDSLTQYYRLFPIALDVPRDVLHQRIEARFHAMLAAGFLDEVEALHQRKDLHPDLPSIRAVGYRQTWSFLDGEFDRNTMMEKAIFATRQLARRQMTWLRHWDGLYWPDSHAPAFADASFSRSGGELQQRLAVVRKHLAGL